MSGYYFCNSVIVDRPPLPDSKWSENDRPLDTYLDGFFDDKQLRDAFFDSIPEEPGVALDVAGGKNGRAARDLLNLGVVTRALVTNYEDLREPEVKAIDRLDHSTGDLRRPPAWQRMEAWRKENAPDGFSVTMHMPRGGLQNLSDQYYVGAARQLIEWAAPSGLLLLQVPLSMSEQARETVASDQRIEPVHYEPAFDKVLFKKQTT